jgi:DNA polymerase I-like protein with 3'-5' exonuclease and polymerase domains
MLDCFKLGGTMPLLQVHDELCFSVTSREHGQRLKEIMENCVQLEVPSKVDLEIGPSWGEAK